MIYQDRIYVLINNGRFREQFQSPVQFRLGEQSNSGSLGSIPVTGVQPVSSTHTAQGRGWLRRSDLFLSQQEFSLNSLGHRWMKLDLVSNLTQGCFFFLIYLNWRLITLQYFSGFSHTLTWICHGCMCVPHPDPPSHLPPHPIPQGHPSAPALSTLSQASNLDRWSISHDNIHVSILFSQIIPPSPSPTESKSLFFTSVSLLPSCI